jgi:SulP family sulfate permease
MVVAIGVGVVLAALLFMKRMSELTHSRFLAPASQEDENRAVPPGVVVYEIAGPLFFGAAQRAMGALETAGASAKVVILALGGVPIIDATGLVALESAIVRLRVARKLVVIAGPLPEPREVFEKANLAVLHDHVSIAESLDRALELARHLASRTTDDGESPIPTVRPA